MERRCLSLLDSGAEGGLGRHELSTGNEWGFWSGRSVGGVPVVDRLVRRGLTVIQAGSDHGIYEDFTVGRSLEILGFKRDELRW